MTDQTHLTLDTGERLSLLLRPFSRRMWIEVRLPNSGFMTGWHVLRSPYHNANENDPDSLTLLEAEHTKNDMQKEDIQISAMTRHHNQASRSESDIYRDWEYEESESVSFNVMSRLQDFLQRIL